jgi:hypothetical protein
MTAPWFNLIAVRLKIAFWSNSGILSLSIK